MPLSSALKGLLDSFTDADLDRIAESTARAADELKVETLTDEELEKIIGLVAGNVERVKNEVFGFLAVTHAVMTEKRRRGGRVDQVVGPELPRSCHKCGCTAENACVVEDEVDHRRRPCAWVGADICDACAGEWIGIRKVRGPHPQPELRVVRS